MIKIPSSCYAKLTDDVKKQILDLYASNTSTTQIAKITNISRIIIYYYLHTELGLPPRTIPKPKKVIKIAYRPYKYVNKLRKEAEIIAAKLGIDPNSISPAIIPDSVPINERNRLHQLRQKAVRKLVADYIKGRGKSALAVKYYTSVTIIEKIISAFEKHPKYANIRELHKANFKKKSSGRRLSSKKLKALKHDIIMGELSCNTLSRKYKVNINTIVNHYNKLKHLRNKLPLKKMNKDYTQYSRLYITEPTN